MVKLIKFNEEARSKLLAGMEQINSAVKVTLGPCGRMVMLGTDYGSPTITKDGVSVAKEVKLKDPFENMGAQFVKEVASKTNDDAGDGTTTATVLSYAMVREGMKSVAAGVKPVELKRGMDLAAKILTDELRKMATPVKSTQDIINIATISANNDFEIGEILASAIEKVGKDGVITVDESQSNETKVTLVEGMQFDKSYISPYFVNNKEQMTVEFKDPFILVTDKKISNMKELLPILESVANTQKGLLIIAEDVDGEALPALVINSVRGILPVCAVKAPGYGDRRIEMLKDIATLTGATLISDELGIKLENCRLENLGSAKSIKVDSKNTTIVDGSGEKEKIEERINEIKSQIKNSLSDYDKENLENRLAKLSGGVALISIGANSETEMKEKKFRVDDTIAAVKAAIEEGIVPGGGSALVRASEVLKNIPEYLSDDAKVGFKILTESVKEPCKQIAENAGISGDVIVNQTLSSNLGYNAKTDEWVDLLESGIIDPVKVTICALKNAVSIASSLLTTECAIVDDPEEKKEDEQGY